MRTADMARYSHSMGLYKPCTVSGARVLLFKSGLHPAYDGPATPLRKLMIEIAQIVQPKVLITTGTGGAIGADVLLGDVVVAAQTRFDCTKQFKKEPWAQMSYPTSALPGGALAAITPDLSRVNAARIPGAHPEPKIWTGDQQATVVTTDFFAFDDSTDF
jgi:nucleoside phosphorylase